MGRAKKTIDSGAYTDRFMVEIARGGSDIMGVPKGQTRDRAITTVMTDFRNHFPDADASVFLELVLRNLNRRTSAEAASAAQAVMRFVEQSVMVA